MPKRVQSSLKGQLLLDGGRLSGSYFHRSVVLICEHNEEGAFGLVLNRPSENRLEDVFDRELPARLTAQTLFGGGPVQPAALSYLHSATSLGQLNVMDQLEVGHDLDELIRLGDSWTAEARLRVFAGYAGWSPHQLDEEMRRDAWLCHEANRDLIFEVPPDQLWRHILRLTGNWEKRLLAEAPEDLGVN